MGGGVDRAPASGPPTPGGAMRGGSCLSALSPSNLVTRVTQTRRVGVGWGGEVFSSGFQPEKHTFPHMHA